MKNSLNISFYIPDAINHKIFREEVSGHYLYELSENPSIDINVSIFQDNILNSTYNTLVSPANSFGFMDGGLDMIYTLRFGPSLQKRVQQLIQTEKNGELLVGDTIFLELDDPQFKHMIIAPTMRVPEALPLDSINAYLAMKAILINYFRGNDTSLCVSNMSVVDGIAIPGLCMGVGNLTAKRSALQIKQALLDFCRDYYPFNWVKAQQHHAYIAGLGLK